MDRLEEMMNKQKELMAHVPHGVRKDVYPSAIMIVNIIEDLLLYLNSLGHKPWRPEPLSLEEQNKRLSRVLSSIEGLHEEHNTRLLSHGTEVHIDDERYNQICRKLISVLGMIEESVEFFNTVSELMALELFPTSDAYMAKRAHSKEEIVDVQFFWLESVIQEGWTPDEVLREYKRKWDVNIKRYEDSSKGDTSWDKRKEGKL